MKKKLVCVLTVCVLLVGIFLCNHYLYNNRNRKEEFEASQKVREKYDV